MDNNETNRRSFLTRAILAAAGTILGKRALAEEGKPQPGLVAEGEPLKTSVYKGRPPVEPLDTMIRFERSDENTGRAMTHEILSLVHEEKGNRSYPWTIYAHLTTSHVEGDACVLCSRLTKNGAGPVERSIGLNGKGKVGLDLAGQFDTGIHTHANSIRLDEGAAIELDGSGKIKMRYSKGRIEFLNGEKCVGHIDAEGGDHAL